MPMNSVSVEPAEERQRMCGRFTLFASGKQLAQRFELTQTPLFEPRYNIAPTQSVAAVRLTPGGRELALLRWGLIPSWATDPAIGNKLLNARCETVAEKPSFRSAFRHRRCLIPASGFYEWHKAGTGRKQPYFIRPRADDLFAFAGLWERWNAPQGGLIESCTILTTEANELMRPLHERMPVLLDADAKATWLDPHAPADALRALFVPFPSERMDISPVDSWVSNPKHEGPRCLEPVGS
jgi:putative SOS response-associated peptidase YedK